MDMIHKIGIADEEIYQQLKNKGKNNGIYMNADKWKKLRLKELIKLRKNWSK
ncbi:MAG: hypothetical protein ACTSRZ_17945 [Promethearchaeota archaeon]